MTDLVDRLSEIRGRLTNATPGPWEVARGSDWDDENRPVRYVRFSPISDSTVMARDEDAEFIAAAPADVGWLLRRLDEARVESAHLRLVLETATPESEWTLLDDLTSHWLDRQDPTDEASGFAHGWNAAMRQCAGQLASRRPLMGAARIKALAELTSGSCACGASERPPSTSATRPSNDSLRWEHPIPVPDWVAPVRAALGWAGNDPRRGSSATERAVQAPAGIPGSPGRENRPEGRDGAVDYSRDCGAFWMNTNGSHGPCALPFRHEGAHEGRFDR